MPGPPETNCDQERMAKAAAIAVGVLATLVVLLLFASAVAAAFTQLDHRWERAAVKAGHAEYYLDNNNERQWRWLPAATQTVRKP